MATQTPNTEEAVNIANEYISSIDNLSAEVQFLLGEIKKKDEAVAVLEDKAVRKGNEVFGRRNTGPMTPKEHNGVDKVRDFLEAIAHLSEEKIALALELRRIVSRAAGRLDYDLVKIRKALGTEDPVSLMPSSSTILGLPSATTSFPEVGGLPLSGSVMGSHSSAQLLPQLQAHQLQAAASLVVPLQGAGRGAVLSAAVQLQEAAVPVAQQQSQKRRKLNETASVLASTPAPGIPSTASVSAIPTPVAPIPNVTPARSRPQATLQHQQSQSPAPGSAARKRGGVNVPSQLQQTQSQQQLAIPVPPPQVQVEEFEGEEEDDDAHPEEEDNAPYCYCHQPSHGEMVACDGEDCPYEWFHLACLGMKHAPKNSKWFCTECQPKQREEGTPISEKAGGRKRR